MGPSIPINDVEAEAISALEPIKIIDATPKFTYAKTEIQRRLPSPSSQKRLDSLCETPVDIHSSLDATSQLLGPASRTVFYLAYGSNLCAETFQGKRGIRPISQLNVLVPELDLTFDLPGVPYLEPCYANTRYRVHKPSEASSEKTVLLPFRPPNPRYRKGPWEKGLVGVVYEVSREDFARIIASEGGGASYQDILVDCYELPLDEDVVPTHPSSQPFKAHTLFSPSYPPGSDAPKGARRSRPDPNYAQASRRYLNLLLDGADQHRLPTEYKSYLLQLRSYQVTTKRQVIGGALFMMVWFPLFTPLYALVRLLADERGRSPRWLSTLLSASYAASWASYDLVFKRIFGDGERTIGD